VTPPLRRQLGDTDDQAPDVVWNVGGDGDEIVGSLLTVDVNECLQRCEGQRG
jgi:hypothetical protein